MKRRGAKKVTKAAKVAAARALLEKAKRALRKAQGKPAQADRDPFDEYITDEDTAMRLARLVGTMLKGREGVQRFTGLEPSAGDGALIKAWKVLFRAGRVSNVDWTAVELQSKFREPLLEFTDTVHTVAFEMFAQHLRADTRYDVSLSNIPYKHLDVHAPLLLGTLKPQGVAGMLLSNNAMHGQDRQMGFWRRCIRSARMASGEDKPPIDSLPALRAYGAIGPRLKFSNSRTGAQRDYVFFVFDAAWTQQPVILNPFEF